MVDRGNIYLSNSKLNTFMPPQNMPHFDILYTCFITCKIEIYHFNPISVVFFKIYFKEAGWSIN